MDDGLTGTKYEPRITNTFRPSSKLLGRRTKDDIVAINAYGDVPRDEELEGEVIRKAK